MKIVKVTVIDQDGNLLVQPDWYPCVDEIVVTVFMPERDAEHRLHTDAATVVHKEWCIGGDKGPCNCGAEQDRRVGKA